MSYINFQPKDYFNTLLYTGTGSTQSVTGVGFQPDLVWTKNRSTTNNHQINDAVRGVNKQLAPNLAAAEETNTGELTAFGSDGFTVGSGGTLNGNGNDIVSWNWKANGAGSSNSDGNASNVTVSADTTRGFSIVKFDVSTSIKTIGHGLGVAPEVIVMKQINGTTGWILGNTHIGWNKYLMFQATGGLYSETRMFYPNSNNPTSSVWETEGSAWLTPTSGTAIAYCFAPKKGFSKFGTYVGNGNANGAFIYTGFKPAFVLLKNTDTSGEWWIINDNKRDIDNPIEKDLFPNIAGAEVSHSRMDFLSNGFKMRSTANNSNKNGNVFFFMAFAEEPLVSSNNIPATAR